MIEVEIDGENLGDGSGYGDGDGRGYGSGSGDGSGYGSGYGSGDGRGDGSNKYWNAALAIIVGDRGQKLYEDGCAIALWKSDKHGNPSNGGNGGPRSIGMIEEIEGPLRLCTENALHATYNDEKWKGERIWIVALYPPFEVADDKFGSLKREILAEIIGDTVVTE